MPTAIPSTSSARPADPRARSRGPATTLVVGLGNPLRGDDGVGWRVAEALRDELAHADSGGGGVRGAGGIGPVDIEQLAVGGLTLMEHLVGYERAILIDAIATGLAPAGTVTCRPLDQVETRASAHLDSSHDAPLPAALEAGLALGAVLPSEIWTVGIEAVLHDRFEEELSAAASAAVPRAVDACRALLRPRSG